jgi:hypothetical protein
VSRCPSTIAILLLLAASAAVQGNSLPDPAAFSGFQDAAPVWEPEKTWVFMVGVLEWKDEAIARFPKENRRDQELAALLSRRGVPAGQILFLEDREATLARIRKEFPTFLAKATGTVFVYYAGHGDLDASGAAAFLPYDSEGPLEHSGWSVRSIFDDLEKHFKGSRAILLADCCYSGALSTEARKRKVPALCLASSQSSAESTGNWTFTEGLIAGFRGEGLLDLDGDGKVQLEELATHSEQELAFSEGQLSSFHAPGDAGRLVIAPATPKKSPRLGDRLEVESKGAWYPARVLEEDGASLRVHYAGYGDEWDEWVGPDRVRPWKPVHFASGSRVDVRWKKRWYASTILEGKLGVHRIHYEGYGGEWDEWVSSARIRSR